MVAGGTAYLQPPSPPQPRRSAEGAEACESHREKPEMTHIHLENRPPGETAGGNMCTYFLLSTIS
ncbi:hypothetical protein KSF_111300 [Reticulibacter mediterranei]|uniref:Uncharacterized protein n=1 Tax=Reticulibacter mediterranei TaxID=2778369 RepID=A0A8J3J2D6_9CHLR|nr:hypothetical protein KSF_111300 [Reticulibacter mediterranei]